MNADDTSRTDSGDWHRQVLDAAPDAMVVVGADERILYVNHQTERLFGYSGADLIGEKLDMLMPERFRAAHANHVTGYFRSPFSRSMGSGLELFGRRADGTETAIEVSLSPVRTKQGVVLVSAAIRDISERKRLAEELRKAHATAEAASTAKSEFLSSMSHELRTPLNAILGFAQLLARDKREPLSDRHKDRVGQILKGGEHLLRLIDDILDLSRIESGSVGISMEPVSVPEVLGEVHATLLSMASRAGLTIVVDPAPDALPMVSADRTRFAQILMNYGSNAIKYNRPGGRIAFGVSIPSPSYVRVAVTDTGMGIPADKQGTLFQPFQRAGQETGSIEGTGIGLVISKRLAELMGGQVGFRSVEGAGAEFWVDMPVRSVERPTRTPAERKAATAADLRLDGKRLVLYVEDNPANIVFMQDLLGEYDDIELVTASSAEVGIELARTCPPAVIIMDVNLPGMSGIDALRALRASRETSEIPVIALTAAASERDKQRGKAAGFYRYMTKPVKVDELLGALEVLFRPT